MLAAPAFGDDWPQFRGPRGDGVTERGRLAAVGMGEPRVAWEAHVGIGYASVAVVGERLYTAGWEAGRTTVHCLDACTGKPIWQRRYTIGRYDRQHEGGPAGTPAVDDGRVYHLSREAELICLRAADGTPLWSRRLGEQLGVALPRFAFTGSPIVHGDQVLVDVGRIVALDKVSGDLLWQSDDHGAAYSSPRPFTWRGRAMVAAFPQAGLVVVDRDNGQEHAVHPWTNPYGNNAVVPVIDLDRLYVSSGDNVGGIMLEMTPEGLAVVWKAPAFRNKMATPVLIDGHLYGFDMAVLKCLDAEDGTVRWSQRGLGKGTLTAAGRTLIILSEEGELLLGDASPTRFEIRARASVLDHDACWTVPVLAHGRFYCREPTGRLVCVRLTSSQ